jgi:hypothetical protein
MYVHVKISRMKLQRNQSLKKITSNTHNHQYVKIKSLNHDDQSHGLWSLDEKTQKKKKKIKLKNAIYVTLSIRHLQTNLEPTMHLAPNLKLISN